MIMEEIRIQYENAKDWFFRNYDNPKERDRALKHYKEKAELLYFFETGHTRNLVDRLRDAGGLGV